MLFASFLHFFFFSFSFSIFFPVVVCVILIMGRLLPSLPHNTHTLILLYFLSAERAFHLCEAARTDGTLCIFNSLNDLFVFLSDFVFVDRICVATKCGAGPFRKTSASI